MFQIGDKVFYPMHGAGIIKAIEEKEVLGEMREYCIITMPASNMDVMIPMSTIASSGIRSIIDRGKMRELLQDFQTEEPDCSLPWKERYRKNMDKMKTGQFMDGAEVVKDLLHRKKEKPLNSSEKQMLNDARKILISEMILIKDITETQAADMLTLNETAMLD